ncbi:hypothetical protein DFH09DRAFT_134264 [Mycena vulgaris]|nr:hypothetical protein DFH09DRAFT_134264 [Mycena vulgaris]
MPTVSLYTTAATFAQATETLDTQINILPFSPDVIRMECAAVQTHPTRSGSGPLVPMSASKSDDHERHLGARLKLVQKYLADGKLVVIKNGSRAWINSTAVADGEADWIHIVFTDSGFNDCEAVAAQEKNTLKISDAALAAWKPRFIIDTHNKTVLEVQNHLRSLIFDAFPRPLTGVSGDMMFKPFLHRQRLQTVVALGGLSECGKSSMGRIVDTKFGEAGRREKFGYLFDNASKQLGIKIYTLPEKVQAHVLIQQIEDYSKAHFWVSILSLESLHRYASIREAKRILGPILQIVYIDVSEEERIRREFARVGSAMAAAKIRELKDKDVVKRARGAELVKDGADFVLDNNGALATSSEVLIAFIKGLVVS